MADIMLTVKNLSVGYEKPLIDNINFTAKSGDIITLIGSNGSGKSTILKTIAGLIERKGGDILLNGKDIKTISLKELSKQIALMLTSPLNAPYMTCREVVETGRYPYTGYFDTPSDRDKKAVDDAINLVEIGDLENRFFSKISDGQRQRVMLARAICQEPDILILDEPTSYLDIHYKIAFMEIIRNLAKSKNVCVVMSMHEIDFVKEISDYVICVGNNDIVSQGETDKVFCPDIIKKLFNISEEMFEKYFKQMKGEK